MINCGGAASDGWPAVRRRPLEKKRESGQTACGAAAPGSRESTCLRSSESPAAVSVRAPRRAPHRPESCFFFLFCRLHRLGRPATCRCQQLCFLIEVLSDCGYPGGNLSPRALLGAVAALLRLVRLHANGDFHSRRCFAACWVLRVNTVPSELRLPTASPAVVVLLAVVSACMAALPVSSSPFVPWTRLSSAASPA